MNPIQVLKLLLPEGATITTVQTPHGHTKLFYFSPASERVHDITPLAIGVLGNVVAKNSEILVENLGARIGRKLFQQSLEVR